MIILAAAPRNFDWSDRAHAVVKLAAAPRRSDWGDMPAGRRETRRLVRVRIVERTPEPNLLDGRVRAVCHLLHLRPAELSCKMTRTQTPDNRRIRRRRALAAHLLRNMAFSTIDIRDIMCYASHDSVVELLRQVRRTPEVIALEDALRTLLRERWMHRPEALVQAAERALWPGQFHNGDGDGR